MHVKGELSIAYLVVFVFSFTVSHGHTVIQASFMFIASSDSFSSNMSIIGLENPSIILTIFPVAGFQIIADLSNDPLARYSLESSRIQSTT